MKLKLHKNDKLFDTFLSISKVIVRFWFTWLVLLIIINIGRNLIVF